MEHLNSISMWASVHYHSLEMAVGSTWAAIICVIGPALLLAMLAGLKRS